MFPRALVTKIGLLCESVTRAYPLLPQTLCICIDAHSLSLQSMMQIVRHQIHESCDENCTRRKMLGLQCLKVSVKAAWRSPTMASAVSGVCFKTFGASAA